MVNRNSKDAHPNWRPNFCDASQLPDIKVVRTNFLINFVFVTAALIFIYFALEREYRAYTLGQAITNTEQGIESAARADGGSLKLSNEFKDASLQVVDIERFFAAPLKAHELLVEFVKLCPEGLTIKHLGFLESFNKAAPAGSKVKYSMNLSGEVDDPLILGDFKSAIEASGLLEVDGLSPKIDESLQGRNTLTGIFPYRMSILLVSQDKAANNKAKGGK